MRKDDYLMWATIYDDTWNVLNMQHILPNLKRWDYTDISNGGQDKFKGPAHMVEGDHYLRKAPNPHPQLNFRKGYHFMPYSTGHAGIEYNQC